MGDAFVKLVDDGMDVRLVGRPRSTHYWRARPRPAMPAQRAPRPTPANALSAPERERVLTLLRGPSFVDKSVVATQNDREFFRLDGGDQAVLLTRSVALVGRVFTS